MKQFWMFAHTFLLAYVAAVFAYAPIVVLGHWQRNPLAFGNNLIQAALIWVLVLACRRAARPWIWIAGILVPAGIAYTWGLVAVMGPEVLAYAWVPLGYFAVLTVLAWWFVDEYFCTRQPA